MEFIDLDEIKVGYKGSTQTVINGVNLDRQITGYRTLNVHGREMIGRDIDHTGYRSVLGDTIQSRVFNSKLSQRLITVDFMMVSETIRDQIEQFEELKYYINSDDIELIFTDDPNYHWITAVSIHSDLEADSLIVRGTIEFIVLCPYKLNNKVEVLEFNKRTVFIHGYMYPPLLETIKIELNEDTDRVILLNNKIGYRIVLIKDFKVGDIINFNFYEGTITGRGGENLFKYLDLRSNFESFTINAYDTISINVDGDVEVRYREVQL